MNAGSIQRYSAADLARRRAHGESRTDLPRVRAKTAPELQRDIADDPDFRDVPENWAATAEAVMPIPKRPLSLRIDDEAVECRPQPPQRVNDVGNMARGREI